MKNWSTKDTKGTKKGATEKCSGMSEKPNHQS